MSLQARLKDAEEKATPGPWEFRSPAQRDPWIVGADSIIVADPAGFNPQDEAIAVEARNALPAVLRLVEAAQQAGNELVGHQADAGCADYDAALDALDEALKPFLVTEEVGQV